MSNGLFHFPWPDLEAPKDTALQTEWIVRLRPDVLEVLCDGLNRAAQARLRARKGQRPLDCLRPTRPSLPLPADRAQGGQELRALCHLVEWAMEILEAPSRAFTDTGRHTLLMVIFCRMSWLDALLVKAYGEDCSLLVWDAVLEALLPAGAGEEKSASLLLLFLRAWKVGYAAPFWWEPIFGWPGRDGAGSESISAVRQRLAVCMVARRWPRFSRSPMKQRWSCAPSLSIL